MRTLFLPLLLTIALFAPAATDGQQLAANHWTSLSASLPDTAPLRQRASKSRIFWTRSGTAALGLAAGAFAGYQLGRYYTPRPRDESITSDEAFIGFGVGMYAGAAFGAAMPSYDSPCPFSHRFWRGLGGATVGSVAGIVLGPFGVAMVAAAFQGPC